MTSSLEVSFSSCVLSLLLEERKYHCHDGVGTPLALQRKNTAPSSGNTVTLFIGCRVSSGYWCTTSRVVVSTSSPLCVQVTQVYSPALSRVTFGRSSMGRVSPGRAEPSFSHWKREGNLEELEHSYSMLVPLRTGDSCEARTDTFGDHSHQ